MKKYFWIIISSLIFAGCSPQINPKINNIVDTIAPQPTKILDSGLPNRHLIHTAFIPQAPEKNWQEPWQDACEEAALLTVKYYYLNQSPSLEVLLADYQQIFSFEQQNNWTSDQNIDQMAQISRQLLNLTPQIITQPTLEELKKYISQDIPVIVPANGKILFKENQHFKNGGPWYHNLVLLGYDDDRHQFIVHDVGTQFGSYFRYSYSLLMESIHDFPSSGKKEDINTGGKTVLILLK